MSGFPPGGAFEEASEEAWARSVRAALRGRAPESLARRTLDGIRIPPVLSDAPPAPMPARPAPLAAGRGWALMQRLDMPAPEAANAQAHEDLRGGADGLVLVLKASALSAGFGLDAEDAQAALEGLEPELFPLRLDAGADWSGAGMRLLGLYGARRYDIARAPLMLNADPFSPLAQDGGPARAAGLAGEMAAFFRAGPARTVFAADTRLFHALGASEAQELALAAAAMVETMRLLEQEGIPPAQAAPRISWLLAVDADQFSGVARLRAARLVHARILAAAGLPPHPLLLQAESAWRMLTRRDAHVNMLRTASAAFAAALGGADAITLLPFTLALGLPDAFARRMARNAQIIAREEAGLEAVRDPAAGSAFVEYFTMRLAERAWEIFRELEAAGGLLRALEEGRVADMLAAMAGRRAESLARRERLLTGINAFPDPAERPPAVLAPAPASGLPPRLSEPFEALRDAAEAFRARKGRPLRVWLARAGGAAAAACAEWTANLLATGGVETPEGDVAGFAGSGCRAAVLCVPDGFPAQEAAAALAALRAAGASPVWIAGARAGPAADGELREGMDVPAFLRSVHEALEAAP